MSTDLAAPEQRRRRLVRRHRLRGDAADPVDAARSVLALHATDPATVHLSVLARCHAATRSDVTHALHEDRTLLRMMAMRRTLFVAPTDLAPMLHHAAAVDVAATMRRRLVKELGEQVTDPPVPADAADAWLEDVEQGVARALRQLGAASGVDLSAAEPRLRTAVVTEPGTDREFRRNITSQVLTLMGAEGRIVRGRTLGGWTSRRHVWEPAVSWWPDGLPHVGASEARRALVEAYLRVFGPASVADVAWWTGWPLGRTRQALAMLDLVEAGDLVALAGDDAFQESAPPVAALLPALDPTPMGWKERNWFLPDPSGHFDRNGNIGPTVWWDGEIVGGWTVRPDGTVATRLTADRGVEAARAVADAAARLQDLLEGAPVKPAFATPMATELAAS